jgi:hypothetical protein
MKVNLCGFGYLQLASQGYASIMARLFTGEVCPGRVAGAFFVI